MQLSSETDISSRQFIMLTFSSQTLSFGNWITRKQEEATPPPPPPPHTLKCSFQKEGYSFLGADPASEGPTVQKLQNPPHTHTPHTHVKNGRKQRKGRGDLIITIMIIKIYGYSYFFSERSCFTMMVSQNVAFLFRNSF